MVPSVRSKLLGFLIVPCLVAAVGPARGANKYEIRATADPEARFIGGTVRLTFVNETTSILTAIPVTIRDGHILEAANAAGKALRVRSGKAENTQDIRLDEPLEPGASVLLRITFDGTYPPDRDGYHLVSGAWHPKALVIRDGEPDPVERQADDYDVTLTLPVTEVVATSGYLVQRNVTSEGKASLRYTARDITDFGFASSPDFLETVLETGGVTIRALYLPGRENWGRKLAEYAARVIPFYVETFGFYPQPLLSILPGSRTATGGYPAASNIIVVHDTLDNAGEAFAEWITAHEIGHQYWGWDCVIDQGKYYHWPGLALGIYMDRQYTEARIPERARAHRNFTERYLSGVERGYDTTISRTWDEIEALPFDFNNIVAHGKAYSVIRMLEGLVGKERFLELTKTLLSSYRGRTLYPWEFQRAAEQASGMDLAWFFRDWFEGNVVLSYEVGDVRQTDSGVEVVVNQTGTAGMPLDIELLLRDGTKARKKIDREAKSQTIVFEEAARPLQVRLDPDGFTPLFSPEGGHVWGRKAQIVDVRFPEKMNWGTNFLIMTVRNDDERAHEIVAHVQTNHLTLPRGWGYEARYSVAPGAEEKLEKDFILIPFPGRERIRLRIRDALEDIQILDREYFAEFPFFNTDSAPLTLPPDLRKYIKAERAAYPRFIAAEQGPFVFYYLEGDSFIEKALPEIARRREEAYRELVDKINPGFDQRVAIYFLPDADSKRVYFGHTGRGWAPGENILVEILNAKERVDPNHELVHIIAGGIGDPPAFLSEGLATYLQEEQKWDGYHIDAWAKAFAARGMLWPVREMVSFTEIGSEESRPAIAYPQAASIVKYLADRFGFEKIVRFYKAAKNDPSEDAVKSNETRLLELTGIGFERLEKEWLERLKTLTPEPVPPGIIEMIKSK